MSYEVSVIMPALNEEQGIAGAIEDVLRSFEELACNGGIIVINDGSTDSTPSIVKGFMTKCSFLTMVSHLKPKGIGGSFLERCIRIKERGGRPHPGRRSNGLVGDTPLPAPDETGGYCDPLCF